MIAPTNATYTFTSSTANSINMYGCLYVSYFYADSPASNLLECDDDDYGGRQFLIRRMLYSSVSYILVVTTYYPLTVGSYSINFNRLSSISMTYTTRTSKKYYLTTTGDNRIGAIVASVVAGVVCLVTIIFVLLVAICSCGRRKKQAKIGRTVVIIVDEDTNNSIQQTAEQTNNYSILSVTRVPPVDVLNIEEPPPPYVEELPPPYVEKRPSSSSYNFLYQTSRF
mgnify:FL=1